ncbi:MAG: tRNA (5-methylaminomethyl-2-thiouridine)(34)-methyltransferase MnmD [Bacteroidota bacterium]|nr:tRNA (5-methylaminomethyl-2-thiouridine)(34)-methyltransferase MnmD [Bacteroidota bacterium]
MNNPNIILEETKDGSHTLFVPAMNEHYHSVNGALQESMHVFIDAGLRKVEVEKISVLEIGFGTGLNAFLTLLESEKLQKEIHFTSLELYPLPENIYSKLNYGEIIAPEKAGLFTKLHQAEWEKSCEITPLFHLQKKKADLCQYDFGDEIYDLIYFDAFAPDKQPEMWHPELFQKLSDHTNPGGILTTYCAKGVVRRAMQAAGYSVERLQGPPGKREMLRATKI